MSISYHGSNGFEFGFISIRAQTVDCTTTWALMDIIELLFAEFLKCFLYRVRHQRSSLCQEIIIFKNLKILWQCVLLTCCLIAFFSKLLFIPSDILTWRIIRNIYICRIIKICKIGNLVSISIIIETYCLQIMLREDMMLID